MFKKRVKYRDFNDVEKEQDFYFHLNKVELVRMGATEGTLVRMQAAVASKEPVAIMREVEEMVCVAYGVRTEDGESFIKTDEELARFKGSPAYDELIVSLLTDEAVALDFMRQLIPQEMQGKLDAEIAKLPSMGELRKQIGEKLEQPNPFKEPENPVSAGTTDNDMPAWFQHGRKPTRQELMDMPHAEMQLAYRMTQAGQLK